MNQQVGASFSLSVLFVAFFAIALYQPETTRPGSPPAKPATPAAAPEVPAATAGVPLVEAVAPLPPVRAAGPRHLASNASLPSPTTRPGPPSPSPAAATGNVADVTSTADSSSIAGGTRREPRMRAVSRRSGGPPPRRAFIEVAATETLAEVSLRLYGTADAAHSLWLVNRDILEDQDAPLRPGTLLRTP